MEFSMCLSTLLYVWINTLHHAVCYDQLVNTSSTEVNSSSEYRYGYYTGSAKKAIDGNFDQVYTNCMHTDVGRSEAWLQIDLGGIYNLKSVKIWYRQDIKKGKDQNTKRLKGFSILASHLPNLARRYQCFQDAGNVALDTVLELNCSRVARYVTIYNDKKNDPGGVFLEICEVEIYGCPRYKYGANCTRCGMCKAECDITGRCDAYGCKEGYRPPFCKVCSPGKYGKDCKKVCGYCEKNNSCNLIDGSCPRLCEPGYYLNKCPTRQLVNSTLTLADSSSVDYEGYPNKTVDGIFHQSHYKHCMHTNGTYTAAWLRINLRKMYNISTVKFWYRNDSTDLRQPNTRRIQGYSIRLSNTTKTYDQSICFQHTGNETLPPIIENKCEGEAQYVWIYTNKRFYDGVFLEICEVQVFGCSYHSGGLCVPCNQCKNGCKENGECDNHGCKMDGYLHPYCKTCRSGFYGKNCSRVCGHCANTKKCNHVTGACPSNCEPGYKYNDKKCDEECNDGTYGFHCRENCSGNCAGNAQCNKTNGSCPDGCADGWKGSHCNTPCQTYFYGNRCTNSCGHCLNRATCDHVTGTCPSGNCEPGYKKGKCNLACQTGFYGNNCTRRCGHCLHRATCDHVTGQCPSGNCEPGYKMGECHLECDDYSFGNNCRETCSGNCLGNVPCNKTDGTCSGGCADGWINSRCNETCKNGLYGKNCSHVCGHCAKRENCDHVTGACPFGCEPGYKYNYKKCNEECDDGTYGYHCKKTCSGNCAENAQCNKTDGSCPDGCADGWIESHCNTTCKNGLYGKNCSHICGHCAKRENCDHVTGACPFDCEQGYKYNYKKCDEECDNGTYGYYCRKTCSGNCAGNAQCNKADGSCPDGCADGWIESNCNTQCKVGFYGKDCRDMCGHCQEGETCHHTNGSCSGLCEPGYQGDKCNTECNKDFYGKDCQEMCGHCEGQDNCNHVNGFCPRLCKSGFQGDKCDFKCDNGTFGLRCNFTCAEGCLSVCNKINGTCDQCQYGYVGEFCNITVADVQSEASTTAAAGIGAFMLILVIIVIVLAIILARKARQKKEGDIALKERKQASNTEENNMEERVDKTENGGPMKENAEIEYIVTDNDQKKTLIKIADLGRIIKLFSMEENKKFTEEFKGIPYGEQQHIPCSVAKLQQNMPKNRYKTTFPYDHSRVVLNISPDNDYINANYIKDVEGKRRYIATQGPRKNTVQDFWAMIWQENIRVIVMVTKLTEGSTIKCEQYWPGQGEQMTSGQFCLQLMSQKDYANYTQRDINLTNKKTKAVKTVNQVQFTAWPDHGTPSPIELLVFYRHVMRFMRMYPECPLVVHCSAGIGRTGTFIALDALYKHGQKEGKIDIVEYVKIMREDRMNMIQNAGQYVFLYKALYEIFKTNGRLVNKEEFIKEVTSQLMSNKAANASQFKKEFNELLSIKPVLDESETKDARQNIDLNTTKTVLPADGIRVLLTSYARGRGNYYNAVPISSYTLRDGLIAAQYPVEGAAVDLVRLLIDQECTILISINQLSDIASSAEWMTTSAEKSGISPYKTMLGTGRSLSNKLKMTVLKMKHDKDSEWHTVKVLEILNWKINEKLPADEDVLIELMNKVQEIIKDPDTKIIVLSRDGATGCGIFCAVYNAIQQLQQDNEVDMFTIVRQLQMRRPEMISSMSEYQCCCQVVANFFSAHKDDIYENAQGRQEVTKQEENIYANTSS